MDNEVYKSFMNNDTMKSLLGQELIRDSLIPEILGKDSHEISYWLASIWQETIAWQLMKIWKLSSSNSIWGP